MSQYPTLHIENFAGIRQADIELAPLTLFVGDNNSGKTYLSTLIWGLEELFRFAPRFDSQSELPPELRKLYERIEKIVDRSECKEKYEVTEELHNEIMGILNGLLQQQGSKNRWMKALFNTKDIPIGNCSLSIPFQKDAFFVVKKFKRKPGEHLGTCYRIGVQRPDEPRVLSGIPQAQILSAHDVIVIRSAQTLSANGIIRSLIRRYGHVLPTTVGRSSFFPDTRNGILLTFHSIAKEAIDTRFGSHVLQRDLIEESDYQFTAPQKEYLKQLVEYSQERRAMGRYSHRILDAVVSFIESKMIRGKVYVERGLGLGKLLYQADHFDKPIPMNLSSGVVTSIAPFLAALKYGSIGNRCFIEEPEMSLHPELEWRMAQVLVRLAHSIGMVLATTHSATIIQHVNNMIKLSNREDRQELAKEYDYEPEDIISSDKVRMYQFDVQDDGMTDVTKMEPNVNGYPVPTFGGYLRKLKDETWAFQNDVE